MGTKKVINEFERIKKDAFDDFAMFGYSEQQIEKEFLSWNIQDDNLNQLKDSIWFFFNRLISEFPRDFQKQAQIYWSMAVFDYKYGNGKTVDMMKKLSADARIFHFESTQKDNNIFQYEGRISVSKDSCAVCLEDKERKFDVKELFQSHPLPHKDCTCSGIGCTCSIGFAGKRDVNGNLIYNLDSEKKLIKKVSPSHNNLQKEGAKSVLRFFDLFKKRK